MSKAIGNISKIISKPKKTSQATSKSKHKRSSTNKNVTKKLYRGQGR